MLEVHHWEGQRMIQRIEAAGQAFRARSLVDLAEGVPSADPGESGDGTMRAESVKSENFRPGAELSEAVVAVAERRLENSGYSVLKRVQCRFDAGTLTLSGRVPSFYMKQVAQTLVMSLQSVQFVDNRLDVHDKC